MASVKFTRGNWKVVRNCCTSGLCCGCRGQKKRPARVVQADGYSEEYARFVAANWQTYKAEAVPS
jgi:hypothetical protein